MKKAFLFLLLYIAFIAGVKAENLDLILDSLNGSSALSVRNSNNQEVGKVDSAGKLTITYGTNNTFISGGNTAASGTNNCVLGTDAFYLNTSGSNNVAVGKVALLGGWTSGDDNTAVGYQALNSNFATNENTAVGKFALSSNTTGTRNVALGSGALAVLSSTGGADNTAIGYRANYAGTNSIQNTAVGSIALFNNAGRGNTAVGYEALYGNTSSYNTAVGCSAYYQSSGQSNNTAVGYAALCGNMSGVNEVAVGSGALGNPSGSSNVAIGKDTLMIDTSGFNNVAVGYAALSTNMDGTGNTALGYSTLNYNISGGENTAVGSLALAATYNSASTAVGYCALNNLMSQGSCTAVGTYALGNIDGANNTGIGYLTANNHTAGSGNVFIGYMAGSDASTNESNRLYISNNWGIPLIYGVFNTSYPYGKVGINKIDPAQALDVNGRIRMGTWTADGTTAVYKNASGDIGLQSSDIRTKKNIVTIENSLGIVQKLRGVYFNWTKDPEGTPKSLGMIAQEVLPVMPELVYPFKSEAGETYYGIHYDKLGVLVSNAIREQRLIIDSQQETIKNLEAQNQQLEARLKAIENILAK